MGNQVPIRTGELTDAYELSEQVLGRGTYGVVKLATRLEDVRLGVRTRHVCEGQECCPLG